MVPLGSCGCLNRSATWPMRCSNQIPVPGRRPIRLANRQTQPAWSLSLWPCTVVDSRLLERRDDVGAAVGLALEDLRRGVARVDDFHVCSQVWAAVVDTVQG